MSFGSKLKHEFVRRDIDRSSPSRNGSYGQLRRVQEIHIHPETPFLLGLRQSCHRRLGLTIWQAVLVTKSGEDATRKQMGDVDHPPFVALISMPGRPRFVVTNGSTIRLSAFASGCMTTR